MRLRGFELLIVEEVRHVLQQTDEAQITAVVDAIMDAKRVFVGGAGRSLLVMKAFAMRLMHMGVSSHAVGETTTPAIEPGDLLIVGTGSGQTVTARATVAAGASRGARTAVMTAHPDAPIPAIADLVLEIHAPITHRDPVRASLQPPGSLFEQCLLLHCDAMIMRLMERLGTSEDEMRARHTKLE